MRAAIYVRLSSSNGDDTSLETQEAAARAYCDEHGLTVVAVYSDIHSGYDLFQRPGLSELRALVRAKRVDAWVSHALDRISRKQIHQGLILTELEQAGVELHLVTEKLEDTPEGRLLLSVRGYAAEIERLKIAERTQRGMAAKTANGRPAGTGVVPYGLRWVAPEYDADGQPIKATIKLRYEECPETGPVLRRIFNMADAGISLRSIARALEAEGIAPPRPGQKQTMTWHAPTLRGHLSNRVYLGEGVANVCRVEKQANGKRMVHKRPESDWRLLTAGTCPVIIDRDQFERVGRRLAQNKTERSIPADRVPDFGLLRRGVGICGYCGHKLTACRVKGGGYAYRCNGVNRSRYGCPGFGMDCDRLDAEIFAWLQAIRQNSHKAAAIFARLRNGADSPEAADLALYDARIRQLDERVTALTKRLSLIDDTLVETVTAEMNRLASEKAALVAERVIVADRAAFTERRRQNREATIAAIEATPGDLSGLSFQAKRRVLLDLSVRVRLFTTDHTPRWVIELGADGMSGGGSHGAAMWTEDAGGEIELAFHGDLLCNRRGTSLPSCR